VAGTHKKTIGSTLTNNQWVIIPGKVERREPEDVYSGAGVDDIYVLSEPALSFPYLGGPRTDRDYDWLPDWAAQMRRLGWSQKT
jgi:hypothetical protein